MLKKLFAFKKNMTARYDETGKRVASTWMYVPPMHVSGSKSSEKHGYQSLLVTFPKTKKTKVIREIRTDEIIEKDTEIKLEEQIKVGDIVSVANSTKGRGFAGGVKRHGFAGGPRTHGQSDRERAPGSSAGGTRMGRLYKGKRMAGKMGNKKVVVRNLKIQEIDLDKRLILVSGMIPGSGATISEITII